VKGLNQWPPLEEVREWAAQKVVNGQTAPAATGKYTRLIVLIDEILESRKVPEQPASAEDQRSSGLTG
jgi:hypothetical protein